MERLSIRILKVVGVASVFGMVGCAPKLASVGTEGLLTRSYSNYSQSTVMRNEAVVNSDLSLNRSWTPVPKKETTPYGSKAGDRVERKRSQVIAPEGYSDAPSGQSEARTAGIPKATDQSVAGFKNMRFVTPQQVRPVRSISEEPTPEPEAQTQQDSQPQAQPQPVPQQQVVQQPQPVSVPQPHSQPTPPPAEQMTPATQAVQPTQPVQPVQPAPTPKTQPTRTRSVEYTRSGTSQQQPAQQRQQVFRSVTTTSSSATTATPPASNSMSPAGATAEAVASTPGASTRVSEVVPLPSKQELRAQEKQRRAEAKRERAAEKQQRVREKAVETATASGATAEAPGEETPTVVATPTRVVSVTELQQRIQEQAGDGKSGDLAVEDFLPGVSAAAAQAAAMPQGQPKPEYIRTPAEENTAAVEPVNHAFKPAETEHVKFSYYDPFGEGNNRFVVVLPEQHFCYPYPGRFLSGYGPRGRSVHTGVDIKGIPNDTVRAAFAGTVRMSKFYSGYGNCVVIRHKNGLETLYGHNSRNLVRVGDAVRAGDPIGLIGRTGRATTEHCHFEVRVQGQHINPALILDYNNMKLRSGVLAVTKQANGRILAVNRASGLAPSQAMDTEDTGGTTMASSSSSTGSKGASSSTSGSSGSSTAVSVYTVKSGDTLWGIARRFGTTVTKLCTLNNLDREATLPLGKKLKVR